MSLLKLLFPTKRTPDVAALLFPADTVHIHSNQTCQFENTGAIHALRQERDAWMTRADFFQRKAANLVRDQERILSKRRRSIAHFNQTIVNLKERVEDMAKANGALQAIIRTKDVEINSYLARIEYLNDDLANLSRQEKGCSYRMAAKQWEQRVIEAERRRDELKAEIAELRLGDRPSIAAIREAFTLLNKGIA